MKVTYMTSDSGHTSTAYLDDKPLSDKTYVGQNKHTSLPVHLRWDVRGECWREVCVREFKWCGRYGDDTWNEVGERPACSCVGVEQ